MREKCFVEHVITEDAFFASDFEVHMDGASLSRLGSIYVERYAEKTVSYVVTFENRGPRHQCNYDTRWFMDLEAAKQFKDTLSGYVTLDKRVRFSI